MEANHVHADLPPGRSSPTSTEGQEQILGAFPRYVLEAWAWYRLHARLPAEPQRGGAAVIPLLGTMALGAQRLLPALQRIYSLGLH